MNFSSNALFHMKTRDCLQYYLHNCQKKKLPANTHTCSCAYQWVGTVSFSENLEYVLNDWSHTWPKFVFGSSVAFS